MITSRHLYQFIVKHSLHRSLSQARYYVMKGDSTKGLILTVNSLNWCKVGTARDDHVLNVDDFIHSEVRTKFNNADTCLQTF